MSTRFKAQRGLTQPKGSSDHLGPKGPKLTRTNDPSVVSSPKGHDPSVIRG